MQWDASRHAGFSPVEPWLPVAAGSADANVALERRDPASIFNLYRRMIRARRGLPSLRLGSYVPVAATGDLLMFVREHQNERTLVALNLGAEPISVRWPAHELRGRILVSSAGDRDGAVVAGDLTLAGHDGVVVALASEGPTSASC
jgi:alpha-glucosidase